MHRFTRAQVHTCEKNSGQNEANFFLQFYDKFELPSAPRRTDIVPLPFPSSEPLVLGASLVPLVLRDKQRPAKSLSSENVPPSPFTERRRRNSFQLTPSPQGHR
ncbi:unnamed protein product [Chondrus crispus]|uniref:Uncharacterized protein n=1 Tax=Chondrus crispus TaxID=2769 RepID=R7QDL6_CHOCR|nr:unnamed protein product [Chondrus crispus]CDF36607.1 unnamed protein product [Chondrus crispus]|eukprot:XP_005716426.1 unnamed protein product [Chondrus crispus]